MAAATKVDLGSRKIVCTVKYVANCSSIIRNASWSKFFKRSQPQHESKDTEKEGNTKAERARKAGKWDGPSTVSRLESLKKKVSVHCVRGYDPPQDVDQKVASIASKVIGAAASPSFKLDDRLIKFKLLTQLMDEFDHPIPSRDLSCMNTIKDVVDYFSTPVQDKSKFEDLAKLNLPKNLHIQWEPVRFDPETDTFFGGQTAFPGRPCIVTSLKYSRKYKGHSGESRNERSITNFELQKQLKEDYEKLGLKMYKKF